MNYVSRLAANAPDIHLLADELNQHSFSNNLIKAKRFFENFLFFNRLNRQTVSFLSTSLAELPEFCVVWKVWRELCF